MSRNRVERSLRRVRHRRAGLFAFSEITVVVALLVILFWTGSQLISVSTLDVAAEESAARACVERPILRISTDQQGDRLWVFRPTDEVVLINTASHEVEKSRRLPGIRIAQVAHSRDTSTSLLVGMDGSLCLYHDGREPLYLEPPSHDTSSVDAAVSADGSLALAAAREGYISGWDLTDLQTVPVAYSLPRGQRVDRMCLDHAGTRIFAAFHNGMASIHDARTGRLLVELPTSQLCTAATWSVDGKSVAIATADQSIHLVDAASGKPIWQVNSSDSRDLMRVMGLAISPDGKWIAAAGFSKKVFVWDITRPDTIRRLSGHDGIVRVVEFSPKSNSLFSGSLDGTIREWSMDTFVPLGRFE